MKRWFGLVLVVVLVACSAAPAAVGYSVAGADGGGANGDAGAGGEGGAEETPDPDAATWSPYLRGALAVQSRGCPSCHQSGNPDDGVLSGQLLPVPGTRIFGKNLTPDPETGIGGLTDTQIIRMLRQGKDEENKSLCNVMPRYTDMGVDEEESILAYLRALRPVHREIPDGVCAVLPDGGVHDGGDGGSSCSGLAGPNDTGPCHACNTRPCQPNGCFNGWVCELATSTCKAPVPGCN